MSYSSTSFAEMRRYTASDVASIRASDETWLCVQCGLRHVLWDEHDVIWINFRSDELASAAGSVSGGVPELASVTGDEMSTATLIRTRHFRQASAMLEGNQQALQQIVTRAKADQDAVIEIDGHADAGGSASYNQSLSERRAWAIRDWLVAHGVAAERISTRGHGARQPAVKGRGDVVRQFNRRAVITVGIRGA